MYPSFYMAFIQFTSKEDIFQIGQGKRIRMAHFNNNTTQCASHKTIKTIKSCSAVYGINSKNHPLYPLIVLNGVKLKAAANRVFFLNLKPLRGFLLVPASPCWVHLRGRDGSSGSSRSDTYFWKHPVLHKPSAGSEFFVWQEVRVKTSELWSTLLVQWGKFFHKSSNPRHIPQVTTGGCFYGLYMAAQIEVQTHNNTLIASLWCLTSAI